MPAPGPPAPLFSFELVRGCCSSLSCRLGFFCARISKRVFASGARKSWLPVYVTVATLYTQTVNFWGPLQPRPHPPPPPQQSFGIRKEA